MESPDLNSPQDEDAAFAALFRAHRQTIPDDGFTSRVLAALPAPTLNRVDSFAVRPSRWPWFAYFGGGVAGTAFALSRTLSWGDFVTGIAPVGDALVTTFAALTEPWLIVALLLSALSITISLPFTRVH